MSQVPSITPTNLSENTAFSLFPQKQLLMRISQIALVIFSVITCVGAATQISISPFIGIGLMALSITSIAAAIFLFNKQHPTHKEEPPKLVIIDPHPSEPVVTKQLAIEFPTTNTTKPEIPETRLITFIPPSTKESKTRKEPTVQPSNILISIFQNVIRNAQFFTPFPRAQTRITIAQLRERLLASRTSRLPPRRQNSRTTSRDTPQITWMGRLTTFIGSVQTTLTKQLNRIGFSRLFNRFI